MDVSNKFGIVTVSGIEIPTKVSIMWKTLRTFSPKNVWSIKSVPLET